MGLHAGIAYALGIGITKEYEMMKHTPGPWQIRDTRSQAGHSLKIIERAVPAKDGINTLIAFALLPDRCPSAFAWQANANLIAAAPELLEALEEFVECGPNAGHNQDLVVQVKKAIAKARGEK
jgi:hypothetical protein